MTRKCIMCDKLFTKGRWTYCSEKCHQDSKYLIYENGKKIIGKPSFIKRKSVVHEL